MTQRRLGFGLLVASTGLSIAWLIESLTYGRGVISTYLAPLAILGNLLAVVLLANTASKRDN